MKVDVAANGTVTLSDKISCDGFHYGHPSRVQTHIHHDHMKHFNTSKGQQDIYMSAPTYQLINARYNADIPARLDQNLFTVKVPGTVKCADETIELFDAAHMLGAVQVAVEPKNGPRTGYSGDFSWPLEPDQQMHVDELVLDATYGSIQSVHHHTLEVIKDEFLGVAAELMARGPINIQAHGGTLEHALSCLDQIHNDWPIITDKTALAKELAVYQKYNYDITRDLVSIEADRPHAAKVMRSQKYIRVYPRRMPRPETNPRVPTFKITATYRNHKSPITVLEDGLSYAVPISDHADIEGTLLYVEATGATKVICDSTRSAHAAKLAQILKSRLNVDAAPSISAPNNTWGA